jgi:DUF1009 family protein
MQRIGLIAGGGQFPLLFARAAAARGYQVVAAAHHGETAPQLTEAVHAIAWFHLGQLGRLIRYFKEHGVQETVMMGSIRKARLFTELRPDIKAIAILARMAHTLDDGVLRAFAGAMEKEGIRVQPATFLLPELLAPLGCWTRRRPGRGETADIRLGHGVAAAIGRLDIGQCVVVEGGSVLAVEAIDGTDATIRRGGSLGSGQAVVVKICKPDQDRRFDMPAVGRDTVAAMRDAGVKALAVEAGRTVVFDRQAMVALADEQRIAIVGLDPGEEPPPCHR